MLQSKRPGIIDTLAAGFGLVNRHLWLVLLLIPFDLALWLGPRISITSLVSQALAWHRQQLEQAATPLTTAYQLTPQPVDQLVLRTQEALEPLQNLNLFHILAWQLPSLAKGGGTPTLGLFAISVESWGAFLLLLGSLAALGLLGACLYFGAIAQFVRGSRFDRAFYLQRLVLNWARLASFFLLVLVALLPVGLLYLLVLSLVGGVGPGAASFLTALGGAALLWLLFYLFFVREAIFVGDVGPLQALWHSGNIVQRNFWSALGLVLFITIILLGIPLLWGLIARHPAGLMAALLGHAYIATGLATASMIYYRDRRALWQQNLGQKGLSVPTP